MKTTRIYDIIAFQFGPGIKLQKLIYKKGAEPFNFLFRSQEFRNELDARLALSNNRVEWEFYKNDERG